MATTSPLQSPREAGTDDARTQFPRASGLARKRFVATHEQAHAAEASSVSFGCLVFGYLPVFKYTFTECTEMVSCTGVWGWLFLTFYQSGTTEVALPGSSRQQTSSSSLPCLLRSSFQITQRCLSLPTEKSAQLVTLRKATGFPRFRKNPR